MSSSILLSKKTTVGLPRKKHILTRKSVKLRLQDNQFSLSWVHTPINANQFYETDRVIIKIPNQQGPDGSEGNQSFATLKLPFWDIGIKLFIKEQDSGRTLPTFLTKRFRQRQLLQEVDLRMPT